MAIATAGTKSGEVNLRKAVISKNLAGLQTLVAIIKDYHAARQNVLSRHFSAAPAKWAMVVNYKDITLNDGMLKQGINFFVHIWSCDDQFNARRQKAFYVWNPRGIRFNCCDFFAPFGPPERGKPASPFEYQGIRKIELGYKINGGVSDPRQRVAGRIYRPPYPPGAEPAISKKEPPLDLKQYADFIRDSFHGPQHGSVSGTNAGSRSKTRLTHKQSVAG
jgi:hypothetical protein